MRDESLSLVIRDRAPHLSHNGRTVPKLQWSRRMNDVPRIVIGTAGWSIPRAVAHEFTASGSHLERYARVLNGAEINSSFHRPHARAVYARWAAATPDDFRFSVKLPRTIT